MIFNIILAKKGRDDATDLCLKSLKKAVDKCKRIYNIDFFIALARHYDGDYKIKESFGNSELHYITVSGYNDFCKSVLLNEGIDKTIYHNNGDLLVIDIDMILHEDYFIRIIEHVYKYKSDFIKFQGYKLPELYSKELLDSKNIDDICLNEAIKFECCVSQFYMSNKLYHLLIDIFGTPLFDEFYKGWGCEDSDISFKLQELEKFNLVKIYNLHDMWYHIWHEETWDKADYDRNFNYFKSKIKTFYHVISKYLKEQII